MVHENITIRLDVAALSEIIEKGLIRPYTWKDSAGVEHREVTLFCRPLKEDKERQTHYLTVKNSHDWKELKDAKGQRVYIGTAFAKSSEK